MQLKPGTNMGLPEEYFLYFKLADNDEAVYPLSALRSVSCPTNAKLDFFFDTANFLPTGTTTTTTDVNFHKYPNKVSNYLIVGDEIASNYFHADVTAVDSITRAA